MTSTAVVAFISIMVIVSLERIVTLYNKHGASILAVFPWAALLVTAIYVAHHVNFWGILNQAIREITVVINSL